MYKEILISIIIAIAITIGDFLTQGYARKSIAELSSDLNNLRADIKDQVEDTNENKPIVGTLEKLHGKWDDRYKKMAYFIEHDELEKVETQLTAMKGFVEMKKYEESVPELDKCIYILEHIKDKERLMIQNIF